MLFRSAKVLYLKARLKDNPPDDKPVTLQYQTRGRWETVEDVPTEVLFDGLLTSFLDIGQVPTQALLHTFAIMAQDNKEKEMLDTLVNHDDKYEQWRQDQKVKYIIVK